MKPLFRTRHYNYRGANVYKKTKRSALVGGRMNSHNYNFLFLSSPSAKPMRKPNESTRAKVPAQCTCMKYQSLPRSSFEGRWRQPELAC